jgi:hypothetical protein
MTTKYKPGQSGNPNGRPKDKTPATQLRKSIAGDMQDIIDKLVELAKDGDVQAAKVLLDRVCPTLKPQAMPVNVPLGDTLPDTGGNIIVATLTGQIPPDIGAALITALSNQGKLVELQELAERLSRIEKTLGVNK